MTYTTYDIVYDPVPGFSSAGRAAITPDLDSLQSLRLLDILLPVFFGARSNPSDKA